MKYLLLLFCLSQLGFISTVTASAITNQFGDKVIYEGKEYTISEYLMESYFVKNPEKIPERQIESTALDRGYIATYEILDGELYVIDIEIEVIADKKFRYTSVFNSVFPDTKRKRVYWKTGLFILPYGGLSNASLSSSYNNYLVLEVKRGRVLESRDYTKKELLSFKAKQFEEFKKTRRYRKLIKYFEKTRTRVYRKNQLEYIFKNDVLEFSKKFLVA